MNITIDTNRTKKAYLVLDINVLNDLKLIRFGGVKSKITH